MKLCQNVHRVCSVAFSIVFIGCWVKSKNARKMALAVRSIFHTITRATSEYCAYKKVPYHRIIFVYFKLDFHCLCSLQKSSSKQIKNQIRKLEISKIKCKSTRVQTHLESFKTFDFYSTANNKLGEYFFCKLGILLWLQQNLIGFKKVL